MKLRSLPFVPVDRPGRFAKAVASGADALILDLEESVAAEGKVIDRPHPVQAQRMRAAGRRGDYRARACRA